MGDRWVVGREKKKRRERRRERKTLAHAHTYDMPRLHPSSSAPNTPAPWTGGLALLTIGLIAAPGSQVSPFGIAVGDQALIRGSDWVITCSPPPHINRDGQRPIFTCQTYYEKNVSSTCTHQRELSTTCLLALLSDRHSA